MAISSSFQKLEDFEFMNNNIPSTASLFSINDIFSLISHNYLRNLHNYHFPCFIKMLGHALN